MLKPYIQAVVEGQTLTARRRSLAMEDHHERRGFAVADRRVADRAAHARRDRRGAGRFRAGDAREGGARAARSVSQPVVDTCGTGGDVSHSFNISTTAAFVVAGAGVKVAKHGNRAMTSRCGSADVLEALGVRIELAPEQVAECVERVGIGFMYAPAFHPAMRFAGPVRREIGIRTVFNLLGPLVNPAGARHQVIGVPTTEVGVAPGACAGLLGSQHALVVHAHAGLDELGVSGPSTISEMLMRESAWVTTYEVTPEQFELERCPAGCDPRRQRERQRAASLPCAGRRATGQRAPSRCSTPARRCMPRTPRRPSPAACASG